jgi:hypothetical protein
METNAVLHETAQCQPKGGRLRRPPRPSGDGGGAIQVSESVVQRIVLSILEELKSERVQDELMLAGASADLKSERVQEMLKTVPEWFREGKTLQSVREFPSNELACVFCALAAAMASTHSLPVVLHALGTRVRVVLHAKPSRSGRIGRLNEKVVALAASIG